MATPQGCIDSVITYLDDLGTGEALAADLTRRRARLLFFLQHVYELVWNYRDWSWTYKESAGFTIAAGANSVALSSAAADFLNFGPHGHLYNTDSRTKMIEKPPWLIERVRRESAASGVPRIFAVFDGKVQIPFTASSTLNLLAFYRYRAATLADDSTALVIPDPYADTVLIPGLIYRSQGSKRDARPDWQAMFQEGLNQMCMLERPLLSSNVKMPLAIKGAW